MKRLVCLAILSAAVLAPPAARAQDDAAAPATSLSLRPFGEMTVGVWRRMSPGLELGLTAGVLATGTEGEDDLAPGEKRTFITVEPALKLFGTPRGELQPYGIGSVFVNSRRLEFNEIDDSDTFFGVSLGAGLEWSPVARIRIGGHAGVRAALAKGESTTYQSGTPAQYDETGWEAQTFTSGLTVYYSF